MTNTEYEQWKRLPHHLVRKYFHWAFSQYSRGISRAIDYRDLVQEANLALVDAWDHYNSSHPSGAGFSTYAYRVILCRLTAYVDANVTPVTIRGWKRSVKVKSQEGSVREKLAAAMGCALFSEIHADTHDMARYREEPMQVEDKASLDAEIKVNDRDFRRHCMKVLKKKLTKEEYTLLLERYSGKSNPDIGATRNYTREYARRQLARAMLRATNILVPELRDDEKI